MTLASLSLSSFKSSDVSGSFIFIHGSIASAESFKLEISKVKTPEFQSGTLTLKLDIILDKKPANGMVVQNFSFTERISLSDDYEQVELATNQGHHVVIDIEESEEYSEALTMEGELKQSIFSSEARLQKVGSVIVNSKKGSKNKDNK